ncbi:hypothetical protein NPX13_g5628 [Xylaria arbuscula]|uniref:Uncharacterized protein n=1 Tax=Xylaria arbuscula TaxID=114810 RepID=A0A9W8NE84_9PEZI|nr:hypothetical protein NPX13_g5628 [Xylaria arbuscula]
MSLINVLVKNRSLLYRCIAENKNEEDADCQELMKRITTVVKDDNRFQSWQQVKSWIRRQASRMQPSKKPLQSIPPPSTLNPRTRRGEAPFSIKASFEQNILPILRAAEMTLNAKKFLDSVISTVGPRKIIRKFRHRLMREELPKDIAPLIFSPLYLKLATRQIRKVTAARSTDLSKFGDSSGDEWSDWEDSSDESVDSEFDDDGGDDLDIMPSIENDDGNSSEDDVLERPIKGQRTVVPSTPAPTRSPSLRASWARTRKQSRKGVANHGICKAEKGSKHRKQDQLSTSPFSRNASDKLAYQQEPHHNETQPGATWSPCPRIKKADLPVPAASFVRPFADLMLPSAMMTPDPEEDSLLHIEALLHDASTNAKDAKGSVKTASVPRSKETQNHQAGTSHSSKKEEEEEAKEKASKEHRC